MKRGGYRKGSGRKKGSTSKIPLEQAIQVIDENNYKTPLQVMIKIMNDNLLGGGDIKLALEAAKGAAPYMHAKLIESKNETSIKSLDQYTDEELQIFVSNDASSDNTK